MYRGIYPGAGGGGGGGGEGDAFAPVTLTGATAEIDASDASDLDIALPDGITRFVIVGARLNRTAGDSALCGVAAHEAADRMDTAAHVFGDSFSGVDMPGPVKGPRNTTGGNVSRAPIALQSEGEFIHLVVYNRDFSNAGTFEIEVDVLPLGGDA